MEIFGRITHNNIEPTCKIENTPIPKNALGELKLDYENTEKNIFEYRFKLALKHGEKQSIALEHKYFYENLNVTATNANPKSLADGFTKMILNSIEMSNKNSNNPFIGGATYEFLFNIVENSIGLNIN